MLRPGLYRNHACFDIDFRIVKVQYRGPKYIKVKMLYEYREEYAGESLAGKTVYPYPETVKIQRKDLKNWVFWGV